MVILIMVVLLLVALVVMNRKGVIEDGTFAVVVVFIVFGVAGYIGIS